MNTEYISPKFIRKVPGNLAKISKKVHFGVIKSGSLITSGRIIYMNLLCDCYTHFKCNKPKGILSQ